MADETEEVEKSLFTLCAEHLRDAIAADLAGETCMVTIGGSGVQRADEFLVREVPQAVSISDRSTSAMGRSGARGSYRVEFNVAFEVWARRATLPEASRVVNLWVERMVRRVAADKTLGGLVIHAEPYVDNGGSTSVDKTYLAAMNCGVSVKAEVDPAKETETETGEDPAPETKE